MNAEDHAFPFANIRTSCTCKIEHNEPFILANQSVRKHDKRSVNTTAHEPSTVGANFRKSARADGHRRTALTFDLYVTRLREEIAAMTTHLGGLDALTFTAGVGEEAAEVDAAVCAGLGWIGIDLDEAANAAAARLRHSGRPISGACVRDSHPGRPDVAR